MRSSLRLLVDATAGMLVIVTAPPVALDHGPIAVLHAGVREEASRQSGSGVALRPDAEEALRWGEPANGLRAALAIRPVAAGADQSERPDLYLVVQNVSGAPFRLSDIGEAPKLRELYLKLDGKTQAGIVSRKPTHTDVVLRPREAVFLLMFPLDVKASDGRTAGSHIAEGALKDTHQSLIAELRIETVAEGAWTGKLRTGEATGAAAADAGTKVFNRPSRPTNR